MENLSQILIITDRKRVFGEDTDMITVLSLTSDYGGTPALIDALKDCREYGLEQLSYYPHFVRILARAFSRSCKDDEYDAAIMGIMPYSIDADKGMSFLRSRKDLSSLVYSDQPYLPVIDLTGYEYDGGEEPMLYLMPRVSDYYRYSFTASNVYPLTNEGLTEAIDRLMFAI